MEMQRISMGILEFDEETREYKFMVEDYRVVTFHFYLKEWSGQGMLPVTAKTYIAFKDRYELLCGNKKHESDLEPKELFTFTNSDVAKSIKIELILKEEYSSAIVEYDILKELR